MNILVDIGHPAHVHFFRYVMTRLEEDGHTIHIALRNLPTALILLQRIGRSGHIVSSSGTGSFGLGRELIQHTRNLYSILKKNTIKLTLSIGGTFTVFASRLSGAKPLVFSDTETATIANALAFPFAHEIITPQAFGKRLKRKQVTYPGLHEMAYLHPGVFTPDPKVLEKYNLSEKQSFFLVRFIKWGAAHDKGASHLSPTQQKELLAFLATRGQIIGVHEDGVNNTDGGETIDPIDYHHLMAFASACITEGSTTALEASVLGTPSVYISPLRPACILFAAQAGNLHLINPDNKALSEIKNTLNIIPSSSSPIKFFNVLDFVYQRIIQNIP